MAIQTINLEKLTDVSYSMKESLRGLKTNIQFCGDDTKVILFTSTMENEGKSTVTFELARSLTESGKSVLFIDSDVRKSVLVGRLQATTNDGTEVLGLTHYLSGQKTLDEVLYATVIPRLYMIFAGPSVANPTEILEKAYFGKLIDSARKQFDYIIVDCAPLGATIDAAVVAKHCDGAVLVVAQGVVGSRMILSAKKQLEVSGVKILGVVLNKVRRENGRYGYGYGYGYGRYYGGYGYGNYGNKGEK